MTCVFYTAWVKSGRNHQPHNESALTQILLQNSDLIGP